MLRVTVLWPFAEPAPAGLAKLGKVQAGLPIVYNGDALLPHPGLARWIEARVRQTSATLAAGGR